MAIKIYNTMTRRKEELVPREAGRITMYVCGPTVYNYIHIGNARTFLNFDVIRRYLEYSGFEVEFIQNITDVDDKIINKADEEGVTPGDLADAYRRPSSWIWPTSASSLRPWRRAPPGTSPRWSRSSRAS
jgi:cysteinyl-tRNA synthetase